MSGPVVTLQSSNCARSVLSAWPVKVISYVCGRTVITPQSRWLTLPPVFLAAGFCVVTRCRVIWGFDAIARAQSAAGDELTLRRVLVCQMLLAGPRSRTMAGWLLHGGSGSLPRDIEACGLGRALVGLWHVQAGMAVNVADLSLPTWR